MSGQTDRSPLSELLWTAWGALGLSSWSRSGVAAVVDPEALIVATVVLGDRRLHLESIDWGIENAPLIMPPRLKRFAGAIGATAAIDEWIGTVAKHSTAVNWSAREAAAMPDFERSRKSVAPPAGGVAAVPAAALRFRSVMGATVRTEVVRAMHVVASNRMPAMSNGDVARVAGVASNQSKAVLDDLVATGFLSRHGTLKRRQYAPVAEGHDPMADGIWAPWRVLPYAPWHVAPALVLGLTSLRDLVGSTQPHSASVDAIKVIEGLAPVVHQLDSSLAGPVLHGSSADILRSVADWSDMVSRRVVMTLASGDVVGRTGRPHRHDDWQTNPWGPKPFG